MSEPVYFASIGLVLGTIILVFAMKYISAMNQARSRALAESGYRELGEKAAAALTSMQADLADIKARLAGIEKILKEV